MPGDSLTKSRHACSSNRSKPACFRLRHRSRRGSNRAVRQVKRHQRESYGGPQVRRSPLPSRTRCLPARTSASPASGTAWFANRTLGLASILPSERRGAFPDQVVQSDVSLISPLFGRSLLRRIVPKTCDRSAVPPENQAVFVSHVFVASGNCRST